MVFRTLQIGQSTCAILAIRCTLLRFDKVAVGWKRVADTALFMGDIRSRTTICSLDLWKGSVGSVGSSSHLVVNEVLHRMPGYSVMDTIVKRVSEE